MSFAWIFNGFTPTPPTQEQLLWILLPVLVLVAIVVVVHCGCKGDPEETAALREPIDQPETPKD